MVRDKAGKTGAGTNARPLFTFSVDDRRTNDELFPAHWAAYTSRFYSDAFIASTAQQFEIDGAQILFIMRSLGIAVSLYSSSKEVLTDEQQQVAVREELKALASAYHDLRNTLDKLSPLARDRLWSSVWGNPDRPPGLTGLTDI